MITAILIAICLTVDGTRAHASDEDPNQRVLLAGQQAMLERHYGQAVRILSRGLKNYPQDNRLRLELGRAYLAALGRDENDAVGPARAINGSR